jgi:TRAP-type uncharacterized transport system substrate-binding protein
MEPIAPIRSRHGRWWATVVGAGPLVVGLLIAFVGLGLYVAYRVLDPTPEKRIVIATGPEEGAYIEFAKRYQPLLRSHGLTVELRTTQGSAENLALLRDPQSGVDAAFVQGGVDTVDTGEHQKVASLGSVAYEPVWLFCREADARDRDKSRLDNLSQLAGWRINTGPSGGGAGPLFQQLAQANQLEATQLQFSQKPAVHAVVDLLQGGTDAVLMVAAADAPLVQYLLRAPGIRLFEFVQSEAYARRFPFLRAVTLPRGIVDLAADKPPQDVRLVAATASLVVREDLHPALVQLLVQAAQQVHGDAGWFSRAGEFPSPSVSDLPLSPEAARLYRDGVPWLQRYLPFWLANFIDRMWFVLLPLVAVMIPLSRILPPLVELRVRSRVFRWYAHLRAVEEALERPAAALDRLRTEIERIDGQVERIGVPLSYTHELYELRSHIELVRKRILDRATVGG